MSEPSPSQSAGSPSDAATALLAIAAYRQLVDGMPTGKVDLQVRRLNWPQPSHDGLDEVRLAVRNHLATEPPRETTNAEGETDRWELAEVFAVEPLATDTDGWEYGEELIGFIAEAWELAALPATWVDRSVDDPEP